MNERNVGASVKARLLNKARTQNVDYSLMLTRYALERLLYRLSISKHRDNFLLKGALLFDLWFDVPYRPTRDIDLLGFGPAEIPELTSAFENICDINIQDGIRFDANTIKIEEIRKEANYAGLRVTLLGWIESAKCNVQVDVGYGDAVTPDPEYAIYPTLLEEFPAPKIKIYPRYTVIAEKLEAIITLGMVNSRLKDYFDLWIIFNAGGLDNQLLQTAIVSTLKRRGTIFPKDFPLGLSDQFAINAQKNTQWNAFIQRNKLSAPSLLDTIKDLRSHLAYIF